jgi:ABC-type bacteriocin/lantibiotic exporter with double-glycine peptidase domain
MAMLLAHHRRPVTLAEIEEGYRTLYDEQGDTAHTFVELARSFGLDGRGLMFDDPSLLVGLDTPCVAHRVDDRGAYPRPAIGWGHFEVVDRVASWGVTLADPHDGKWVRVSWENFLATSTGVFLEFKRAELPAARVVRR